LDNSVFLGVNLVNYKCADQCYIGMCTCEGMY